MIKSTPEPNLLVVHFLKCGIILLLLGYNYGTTDKNDAMSSS